MSEDKTYNDEEELKDYVLTHYFNLFTRMESLGVKAVLAEQKAQNSSPSMANRLRERFGAENNQEVVDALSNGVDAFRLAIYNRLMKEHSQDIHINRCPKCDKVLKTPRAKQCKWCFHSWHSCE